MIDNFDEIMESARDLRQIFMGRTPLKGGRLVEVEKASFVTPEKAGPATDTPRMEPPPVDPRPASSAVTANVGGEERVRDGGRNGKPVVVADAEPPPAPKGRFGRRF